MSTYVIFLRTSTPNDSRVRWHKMTEVEATSRPAALRACITPAEGLSIDRNTTYVQAPDGGLWLAEREDRIDFDHYDFDSTLVEASA